MMERCYLLGAGASHGYRKHLSDSPPLTNDIFSSAMEKKIFEIDYYHPILDYLKKELDLENDLRPEDLYCDTEEQLKNIHENFLQSSRKSLETADSEEIKKWTTNTNQQQALVSLSHYLLYDVFRIYISKYNSSWNYYSKLIEHSNPEEDFMITLNYDVLLERSILDSGGNFTYPGLTQNNGFKVIKPHGSLNWMKRRQPYRDMSDVSRSIFGGLSHEGCQVIEKIRHSHTNITNPQNLNVLDIGKIPQYNSKYLILSKENYYYIPAIIPPLSKYKAYDRSHMYNLSWNIASKKLEDISELVIIGTQVRQEDERLCNILEESVPRGTTVKIYTGSQSDEVGERLESMLKNPTIEPHNAYFDAYVDSL